VEAVSGTGTSGGGGERAGLVRHVGLRSATLLVLANIIGAGIFTTTGFQAADLGHPGWILALWVAGGVLAFCGAVCYGELGAAMPRAGAEYVYLRETYGGMFGFMSGFVSLVAGFSAPIASASKGFSRYLTHFFPALAEDPRVVGGLGANDGIAVGLVWVLIAIQLRGARSGMRFSDVITSFKVVGVVAIILGAAAFGRGDIGNLVQVSPVYAGLDGAALSEALATSLIFVMFCYSGWNASAYLAAEFENPQRDLPRSLLLGTALVVLLYLGINLVYFYGADVEQLAGVVEVGLVASRNLFGPGGTSAVTLVLCLSLVASATAMTIAGPRVYYALGKDYPLFGFLSRTDASRGSPVAALLLQGSVTTAIIVSGSIDQIMQYAGFTLTLFASLAVSCVIVLRFRRPELPRPFRTWGYPATPILFLTASAWMMFWSMRARPLESTLAFLTVLAGGLLFVWTTRRGPASSSG
jgi:APA family basic amino acid/polyamine antiporter